MTSIPRVTLSGGHDLTVNCELAGPIVSLPPKPKIATVDRPGAIGLTQWVGQDPYEMRIPIRLDGFPGTGVENRIRVLEALGEVQGDASEPPAVTVTGDVPIPHPNLTWRVSSFDDPSELLFLPGGTVRCRYVTTVNLIQLVSDTQLQASLTTPNKHNGFTVRTWTVTASESSFTDVARDAYKDPSRAGDIAVANGLHLGARLKTHQKLKLPA